MVITHNFGYMKYLISKIRIIYDILMSNYDVKLIWIVIPLVFFGIMGIQESFAEEKPQLSLKLQIKQGVLPENIICNENMILIFKSSNNIPACVKQSTSEKLIQRGWILLQTHASDISSEYRTVSSELEVEVKGEKQVRRGTTHSIEVQVFRDKNPVEDARVFITIEDYGENIIREFKGYTNQEGYFVFSWEIPQHFDDIETLLAFVDVTDGNSSKTKLFKFQVYCYPGEKNCKMDGN